MMYTNGMFGKKKNTNDTTVGKEPSFWRMLFNVIWFPIKIAIKAAFWLAKKIIKSFIIAPLSGIIMLGIIFALVYFFVIK